MRITIIGTGYVGLVSGACLADFGHHVTCVDNDPGKIERIRAGVMPIYEPGLDTLVARNVAERRLHFTTGLGEAVRGAAVVFIAVGTPSRRGDGHADLTYVHAAAGEIAAALDGFTVIVTKSTVPVGTGDAVEEIIRKARPDADFAVVSNPEFLREGAAIEDFKRPDRIVVGANEERARDVMAQVYRPLHLNQGPLLFTDRRTSELIKYAANAFLATKITFINEIADLCEKAGANVQEVARGIGLDNRIGSKFLHAGPGFGGSCFPKDALALLRTGEEHGVGLRVVSAVVSVNEERKAAMAERILAELGDGPPEGKTVALLGLTFKPNTDDMRDSPSIPIARALAAAGVAVRAFDPQGMEEASSLIQAQMCSDAYDCLEGADVGVIVTEWDTFRALDFDRVKAVMRRPVIVDLRNVYRSEDMARHGLRYVSIGRAAVG